MSQQDINAKEASLLAEIEESLPFPDEMTEPDHVVRATETCSRTGARFQFKASKGYDPK